MTEQEFRERLKRAARNDGLSPEHQVQVLARRERNEHKVRNWHKAKYIVAIALLLAMGATGAVASSWGAVNWDGEPVDYVGGSLVSDTETGARLQELNNNVPDKTLVTSTIKLDPEIGEYAGILQSTSDVFASSLDEMKAWVEADGTLEWVKKIPSGYDLKLGRVAYACNEGWGMELLSQEFTDDGYMVIQFLIPEEYRYMCNYFIRLINEKEDEVTISIRMDSGDPSYTRFATGDDSSVTLLNVTGMDHALEITTKEKRQVALYQTLPAPVKYYRSEVTRDGQQNDYSYQFTGLTIECTTTDLALTAADLLAIFGLEAQ